MAGEMTGGSSYYSYSLADGVMVDSQEAVATAEFVRLKKTFAQQLTSKHYYLN
jgi:hypothetical protein